MAIHQNGKFIEIDQKKYLGDVLNRFETYHSKRKANPRTPTPLPAGLTLVKARDDEDTSEAAAALPYRELLIGSFMYLAVGSRPAADVSILCSPTWARLPCVGLPAQRIHGSHSRD